MCDNEKIAYDEGVEAGNLGYEDLANPYPFGSDEAMSWEDGRSSVENDE